VLRAGKEPLWSLSREEIELVQDGEIIASLSRSGGDVAVDVRSGRPAVLEAGDLPSTTSLMLLARQFGVFKSRRSIRPPLVHRLRPMPERMRDSHPLTESPRLTETAENIATALKLMEPSDKAAVVAAMAQVVPGLVDIEAHLAGRHAALAFTQMQAAGRNSRLFATEMSDGALRALAVVVAAQQMTPNELLVIEEPEVNLHPGAANVVYDVLHAASGRGVVLITTHSPELLDRARDDEIQVCQYEDGVTKIGPLSSAQRDLVRQGLFSVAELMRADELRREGAPPRVVSD
jgi:type I restriction enzyme M protein